MKVVVTGSTGFTGGFVVPRLLATGAQVRCIARQSSDTSRLPTGQVEVVHGDLNDRGSLERAMQGCDALVNIASLGFGHAENIVRAAEAAAVARAIFVSTTAIFTALNAPSKTVRLAAEETVRASRLAQTILRPTMIYGTSEDRNICRLIRYLNRWRVVPVIGSGEFLQQPVYVDDVAAAVVLSVNAPAAVGKAYNISGAAPLTYNQVIQTICELLHRRVIKWHIPSGPTVGGLRLAERLRIRLPIKAEQIQRLNEHKAFDHTDAARDFGYAPRSFGEGVRLELEQMGLVQAEAQT